jgi:hypothetical protein
VNVPSATTTTTINWQEYCVRVVKDNDYEGYLATLLLPKNVQLQIFAVNCFIFNYCHNFFIVEFIQARAFNVELSLLRNRIERYSGSADIFRLDFWGESLDTAMQMRKGPMPRYVIDFINSL